MKKCSKNSVFFTIRVSEFGASIFGWSNGPNISGFRIIRISGLQHCIYLVLMTSTGEANNVAQNPATTAAEK